MINPFVNFSYKSKIHSTCFILPTSVVMEVSSVILAAFLISIVGASSIPIQSRIQSGYLVRSAHDFPYFVHIIVTFKAGSTQQCAGTVITDRWVLTSYSCTNNAAKIKLYFGIYQLNATVTATQMEVGPEAVVPYPTKVDDISLILLPTVLFFGDTIQAIKITQPTVPVDTFLVAAGFQTGQNLLKYGFFNRREPSVCRSSYSNFDEFKQICATGYTNPYQRPCKGHEGSGLVRNWPETPYLVGIFSSPSSCSGTSPAVYVNVIKYIPWIESELNNTPPPVPTTTAGSVA